MAIIFFNYLQFELSESGLITEGLFIYLFTYLFWTIVEMALKSHSCAIASKQFKTRKI